VLAAGPALADDATRPLTLEDAYAAALRRSETIASQSELIHQAEERYQQARGALLPNVNGVASYTWQETPPSGVNVTPSNLSHQPLAKLTATQPLFQGFREFAGLRQTRALIGAQNEDYQNARLSLFKDVLQNYYNILTIERDMSNLEEEIRQNEEREKDIRGRVRIGRSRQAELLNVQATIATLRAQIEQLRGQRQVARDTFAFLTGLDPETPLRDAEEVPEQFGPLTDYLAGLEQRPDVQANEKRLVASQESVRVARGAHLPSIDLNGNYYLDRPGYLKDINWDVTLALTVPIYAGGALQSKVREAASQRTQAELSVSQVRRLAEQEIRSLYQTVLLDRAQLHAFDQATSAARRSFEAQSREYRLGLVTNLDVLQALTAYLENQRALDRSRFTLKLDYQRLLAASAQRPGVRVEPMP
jgi:outer membrane protein